MIEFTYEFVKMKSTCCIQGILYSLSLKSSIPLLPLKAVSHILISLLSELVKAYPQKSYFHVLFKQATGKNMLEYQTAIRLEKSKEYLIEGTYSIGEISVLVEYEDIHYFSKIFKKVEGLSLKKYVETIRNS